MNNEILKFELKHWFKSPIWYFFTICFFLFALVTMLGTAGYFDGPQNATGNVKLLNSSFELTSIGLLLVKLLLFIAAVVGGYGLIRDYKNNSHSLLYSFPISKGYYFKGKLLSAIIMIGITCLLTMLGIFIGELLLGTQNPKIGTFNIAGYLSAVLVYLLPTIICISIFIFTIVGLTRNVYAGFIIVIFFALFQLMVESLFFSNKFLAALLDPFGQNAFYSATGSWDFEQRNTNAFPINYLVIINRLFWLALAGMALKFFYNKFDFQYESVLSGKRKKSESLKTQKASSTDRQNKIRFDFSTWAKIRSFFELTKYDFFSIVKSWLFLVLIGAGIFTILFIQLKVTNTGEMVLHPHTRLLVSSPLNIYALIIIFGTFIFSGFLVNRAKQNKIDALINVSAVKNWQLIFSKIFALALMQICLLLLFLFTSIGVQIYNGYHNFEIGLYLFQIFILSFPILVAWNFASVFAHTLVPNIYLSLFLLTGLWLGAQSFEQIGIDSHLLKFNLLPQLDYSDFQGYGQHLKPYLMLQVYWLLFGLILLALTFLMWNRGSIYSFKERLIFLKKRINPRIAAVILLLGSNFIFLGFKIHQGESTNNSVATNASKLLENYKTEWEKYSKLNLPSIKKINLNLDIFPDERSLKANGEYLIINDSDENIDTILIRTGFDERTTIVDFEYGTLIKKDDLMKSYLFELNKTLTPGDSIQMNFEIESASNSLFSRNSNVLKRGTFIKHDILPRIGYQFVDHELPIDHKEAARYNYYYRDARLVDLNTTISTSSDQVAIAPGSIVSENSVGNRRVFRYKTENPIKFNFSFHSSDFKKSTEIYKGRTIDIFHEEGHERNANLMADGLKASLDFNTKHFGDYPFNNIRIVEFPQTEESYTATLTSNNVPTSEILFNINSDAMQGKVNLPFYVMVHELTHNWFGNQCMPADQEGAKMLTESITEYITFCIYREKFGQKIANEFLKLQHKRYNRGRKNEKQSEPAMDKILTHQQYIAYGKGAISFNALANKIGEDKMIGILGIFLDQYTDANKSYPNSRDLLMLIKKETKNLHNEYIDNLFSKVVHFENKINSIKNINDQKVELEVFIRSVTHDNNEGLDNRSQSIQIGQFDEKGEIIEIETFNLSAGINNLEIELHPNSKEVIVDPLLLLMDHNLDDNRIKI